MKKNYLLLCLLTLLTLSSCRKTEYTQAIPMDAAAVVSIDMKAIAEKSGLGDEENESLKQHLTNALKTGLTSDAANLLSKIMDDPGESGFDFGKPVYVYTAKEFNYTPVVDIRVDDKGDLSDLVDALTKSNLCTPVEKAKDYQFTVIAGKMVMAFNRGTALCVQSKEGMTDRLHLAFDRVMAQKKEQSIRNVDAFDALKDRQGEICFLLSTKQSASSAMTVSHAAPEDFYLGDVNFNNGSILMKVDRQGKDDKTPSALHPVSNALLPYLPQHLPIMFTIGMNGAEAYKHIVSDGTFGLDDMGIPAAQKIFEAISGDLTIGYSSFGKSGDPSFLAYAQIKDPSMIRSTYPGDVTFGKVEKKGADDYAFGYGDKKIYYGTRGNMLYITNDAGMVAYKVKGATYAQNSYAGQAKGKSLFFVFDTSELTYLPKLQQKMGPVVTAAVTQNVQCVRGYNVTANSWNVEMIMKDKQTNTLKQFVRIVRQIAGM
jgi:hypothetical protein